jgi:hypothetical protein
MQGAEIEGPPPGGVLFGTSRTCGPEIQAHGAKFTRPTRDELSSPLIHRSCRECLPPRRISHRIQPPLQPAVFSSYNLTSFVLGRRIPSKGELREKERSWGGSGSYPVRFNRRAARLSRGQRSYEHRRCMPGCLPFRAMGNRRVWFPASLRQPAFLTRTQQPAVVP